MLRPGRDEREDHGKPASNEMSYVHTFTLLALILGISMNLVYKRSRQCLLTKLDSEGHYWDPLLTYLHCLHPVLLLRCGFLFAAGFFPSIVGSSGVVDCMALFNSAIVPLCA